MAAAIAFRLPLFAPLVVALGAAAYLYADREPSWGMLTAPLLLLLPLGLGWLRAWPGYLRMFCVVLALAGGGAGVAKLRAMEAASPVLRSEAGPVRVEGRLIEIDVSDRSRRLRLEVYAISDVGRADTPRFVRFSYRYPINFVPGRSLSCLVILLPPPGATVAGDFDFRRDAWFEQLGAVGFAVGRCEPMYAPRPANIAGRIEYFVAAVRRSIAEHVSGVAGAEGGAFAAAVVTGDRSFMSPDDVEALRQSGLAHLLAISGLHMALAGGAFFTGLRMVWPLLGSLALRFPAVKVAAGGAIIGCTVYFLLSGGSIATQRAYVMALIAFSAKLLDKPALSLRSLAVAFLVIVMIHPEAVVTPGFQMSFAATAALIGSFEAWPKTGLGAGRSVRGRVAVWGAGVFMTSVTASLATMPFALFHFDRAASLSIVANLLVTPIVSFWAAPTAVVALLAALVGQQDAFLAFLGASLGQVLEIAHWVSQAGPEVEFKPVSGGVLALAVAAISLFSILPGRLRYLALIPLVVAGFVWQASARPVGLISSDGAVYLRGNEGWVEFDRLRTGRGLTPLSVSDHLAPGGCGEVEGGCSVRLTTGEGVTVAAGAIEGTQEGGGSVHTNGCVRPSQFVELRVVGGASRLRYDLCRILGRGSAEIFLDEGELVLVERKLQSGRPWSARP